jgi:multiple sugar transport system permease protein
MSSESGAAGAVPRHGAPAVPFSVRVRQFLRGDAFNGVLFIAPAVFGFFVFYLYPAIRAIDISFTDWNLLRSARYVGFSNYIKLWNDPNFWQSVKVTVLYVLYNIPVQTVLALALAILMDRLTKSLVVRAIVIFPYLISNVVVALIWLWMLDPILGIVNIFLDWVGIGTQAFVSAPDTALISVAGINTWRHTGFTALLFYAGLQSIPRSLYEAASLDGAGEWGLLWHISLPLLRPVMVFVLVTSVIGSFQIFDTIAVATGGGPSNSTRVLVWYIYENAFRFFKMGYASAMSVVLFLALIVFTLVQMRLMRAGSSDLT